MSKKETKQRISFAKGESVSKIQVVVILFVIVGCIMLFLGNQRIERYRNVTSIENLTLDELQQNMYVKGKVYSTLCCYGTYNLYECYVVPIGSENEQQQYITVFADLYHSVELEELPTLDYVRSEVGMAEGNSVKEGVEIFGEIKKIPKDVLNYDYLKQQLGSESEKKINSTVSEAYYIHYVKEESIRYWWECGITLVFCGIVLYLFLVIPSYRRRVLITKDEEYTNPEIRQKTRQKVTNSIQHFIDNVYDEITMILVEHSGNIAQISNDTEVATILNCFIHATYDKVYEEYVNRDDLYTVEFVMKNGETIESAMNLENIIFWYGSANRMDHVSCGKIKRVFYNNRL